MLNAQCTFFAGTLFIHQAMNKLLTNIIAGKLMNIKKIKLCKNEKTDVHIIVWWAVHVVFFFFFFPFIPL